MIRGARYLLMAIALAVLAAASSAGATVAECGVGSRSDARETRYAQRDHRGVDLSCQDLSGLDFSQANLAEANLSRARLTGADMTQARLEGADLTEAVLEQADMVQVKLVRARGQRAVFDGARLIQADMSGADFRGASFRGANLTQVTVTDANFEGADFTDALGVDGLDEADVDGAAGVPATVDLSARSLLFVAVLIVAGGAPYVLASRRVSQSGASFRGARWLLGFFVVGGLIFTSLGMILPVVRLTFLLIGGIWVAVADGLTIFFARSALHRQHLETVGIAGSAQVISAGQTGISVNDQPMLALELEVSLPDRPKYRVTKKMVVPMLMMMRLGSGTPLAVKVSPTDPNDLIVKWDVPITTGSDDPAVRGFASAAELLRTGIRTTATVAGTFDVGMTTPDGDPIEGFVLDVAPPDGRPPYQVRVGHRVPRTLRAKPTVGARLDVAIDPTEPGSVAIDWVASGLT